MGASIDLYTPPDAATLTGILGRYRRPVYERLAERYIAAWTAPGDLVLNPFCQDATVLRAATACGRRAVAVAGNPLLALLARVEAAPPSAEALRGALRRIEYAPKLDEPLGVHLDGLYRTACSRCGEAVPAESFVWDRASGQPVLREYVCPRCHYSGREPVPLEEVPSHLGHDPQGFHRHLVAGRLRVEEGNARLEQHLLDLYTPRNLYALTSLMLKLELLFAGDSLLDALRAALLDTMDAASKLQQAGDAGPARSLQPPRQFREANVWRAFAAAVEALTARKPAARVPLASQIEQVVVEPPPQGAVGFAGAEPLARTASQLRGQVALALARLPRFDPVFAALSYLWSGWLLGREGSRAAARLLGQRARPDGRYQQALQAAMHALGATLAPEGRLALVVREGRGEALEGVLRAAGAAGLPLVHDWHGVLDDRPGPGLGAGRAEHHLAWARPQPPPPTNGDAAERARAVAGRVALAVAGERAEPLAYTFLHGPIWSALAREGLVAAAGEEGEPGPNLRKAAAEGVSERLLALAPGREPETVTWQAREPAAGASPLSDRVEAFVHSELAAGPLRVEAVTAHFPPSQVPAHPLIVACLDSYGERTGPDEWALAAEEAPARAAQRRRQLLAALEAVGERLGYTVRVEPGERQLALGLGGEACAPAIDLEWCEDGALVYGFLLREEATSADLRSMAPPATGRRVLVIPERRVALWRHKLAAAPPWSVEMERAGWAFLRQTALEELAAQPVEREHVAAALGLAEAGDQLSLFR